VQYGCFFPHFEALPLAVKEKAAEIKANHALSLANAWIAACAVPQGAQLVHKNPEFLTLGQEQHILPYKSRE
jgi:predicted nucleic acid-binding protein